MIQRAGATWRRLDVDGTDTCTLLRTEGGWTLKGRADFAHDGDRARLLYRVDCASDWSTRGAEISGSVGSMPVLHRVVRERGWSLDGAKAQGLDTLVDIDFGFTPATNFLLMRRLSFPPGDSVEVSVAWFDVGEQALTKLPQRYTRRGAHEFWYESPTVGYAARVTLADNGFVRDYPGLWTLEAVF